MTMVADLGLDAGIQVVRGLGPAGYRWIRRRLRGKVVLVIGPPHAGKTSFIDYLCWNVFRNERYIPTTLRPKETELGDLKMGRNGQFNICIQKMVDFPGQIGAASQAKEVFERRPHAIIIFTNLADAEEEIDPNDVSDVWLRDFCQRLETLWVTEGRRSKSRMQTIIIAMNKSDKLKDVQTITTKRNQFLQIVTSRLHTARGSAEDEIAILPCTLVANSPNSKNDEEVQNIVLHLAQRLIRK